MNNFDLNFQKKTLINYKSQIKKVLKIYENEDLNDLFLNKIDDLMKHAISLSNSLSSQKSYLIVVQNVLKLFKFPDKNIKIIQNKVTEIKKLLTIETDIKKKNQTQTIDEAYKIMEKPFLLYDELKDKLTEKYDMNRQNASVCFMLKQHGAMRCGELMSIIICKDDNHKHPNYINIDKKLLIINEHKTFKKYGVKNIKLEDEFIDLLKPGIGLNFILNEKRLPFKTSGGLSDFIEKHIGEQIYTFRKSICSLVLFNKNIDHIKSVEIFHGHSLQTMIDNYNTFN